MPKVKNVIPYRVVNLDDIPSIEPGVVIELTDEQFLSEDIQDKIVNRGWLEEVPETSELTPTPETEEQVSTSDNTDTPVPATELVASQEESVTEVAPEPARRGRKRRNDFTA